MDNDESINQEINAKYEELQKKYKLLLENSAEWKKKATVMEYIYKYAKNNGGRLYEVYYHMQHLMERLGLSTDLSTFCLVLEQKW